MATGLSVRVLREEDLAAVCETSNWAIANTASHFGQEPETVDVWLDKWRKGRRTYPWLAAEVDGAFAGHAYAGPFRTRASYRWTVETSVYVQHEMHGHGVGRSLYDRLMAVLIKQGFRTIIGGVTLPNPASVRLHESFGFEPVGVFREVGRKFNQWHDVGFWQRMIADNVDAAEIQPVDAVMSELGLAV